MYKHEPVAKKFYDGLDNGKFMGLKCAECGHVEFPPYPACNICGHVQNEWVDIGGEDVIVEEIYSVSPMMTIDDFMPYAPIFSAECHMDCGPEFACLIFGVTRKNYKEIRETVPLRAKLVVMPMSGYNTFAVAINGAVPVRRETNKTTMDQVELLKTAALHKEKKQDNGLDGEYKLVVKAMGRTQSGKLTVLIDGEKFGGVIDVMDSTTSISNGVIHGEDFEFSVEARGSELKFSGRIGGGRMTGTARFGMIKMSFEGERL